MSRTSHPFLFSFFDWWSDVPGMTTASAKTVGELELASERGFGWGWWLGGFLFVLLIYVLSFGPVSKLYYNHSIPRAPVDACYAPLKAAGRSCRPLQRFLDWYVVDLWGAYPASPPFLDSPSLLRSIERIDR